MKPGEFMDYFLITEKLQEHVDYTTYSDVVYNALKKYPDLFDKKLLTAASGRIKAHFALRQAATEEPGTPAPSRLESA